MTKAAIVLLVVASLAGAAWAGDDTFKIRFSFTDAVSTTPITGRIVLGFNSDPSKRINNPDLEDPEPTFAWEVRDWKPGETLVLDRSNAIVWHGDLDSLDGWYAVQAGLKTNRRARSFAGAGNAETARSVVYIEKGRMCRPLDLLFDAVWRGPKKFKETDFIKEVNIRSPLLTKFYGEPDSILAAVILPQSYFREPERRYPSVYVVGGWGSTHYDALDPEQQQRYGMSGLGEEKIFVFVNGQCRSGFHAFASSETNGPREETFFEELVPYIERTYRVETDPRTRFVMGQSTGAWAALWLLLKRPDQLGGAFAGSPDPIDFTEFTGQTNIYAKNANMYFDDRGEPKRFIPGGPEASPINMTIEDFTGVDRIAGWGEQMYSFDAAFSPRGADGEPRHLFDWKTGKVDPVVAAAWRSHDLSRCVAGLDGKARKSLQGKIHIYVLEKDMFGLNRPVVPFQKALAKKGIAADIRFIAGGGHVVWSDEIRKSMHEYIDRTVAEAHARGPQSATGSCATFVMSGGKSLLVGHNLDEAIRVPGLIVVNPRGIAKENRTLNDIKSGKIQKSSPRVQWTSKYGSITYNSFGRELPDGGLNEAGLYVGEMTLISTVWPGESTVPRFYHNLWIQYLLDNFASVDEAVASLSKALPEGHCKWHFMLADKAGDVAVIEFLQGKPTVYRGASLPHPILCNDAYDAELKDVVNYKGFGGAKDPEPRYEREDPRFRWAAVMLADKSSSTPSAERAFAVLSRMDLGTTKWSVVYDLRNARLYYRTSVTPKIRWVDFAAFDFGCAAGPRAVDIDLAGEGDMQAKFVPLTDDLHRQTVARSWAEIDAGTMGNMFFKPPMVKGLGNLPATFRCAN